jgi:uncharacterized integral membrane protein
MRILYWGLAGVGAVIVALFAVSNRASASLGLWPLPFVVDLPLYLLVLLPLLLGFLAGRLAAWFAGRGRRRGLRRCARRIEALERELAATQALLDDRTEPAPTRLPVSG